MILWVGFWTAIVGLFDVVIGHGIYNQLRTTQFVTAPGEILSSEVESDTDSDGTTYRPKVTYEYEVNNEILRGNTIRYGEASSSDSYAHEFVADRPVGEIVDVYFNPSNPSDAVLVTGIEGSDLFMLMFMTPFNMVMLGGWYFLASTFKHLLMPNHVRPCRYVDDGYELRIMIDRVPLIAVVGISLLALCFVSVFIVGFGVVGGFRPDIATMVTVWSIILSITLLTTAWFAKRNWSGYYDILVHRFDQKITMPPAKNKNQEVTFSLRDIERVYVDRNVKTDSDSDEHESFFVRIKLQPNSKATQNKHTDVETLSKFHDEDAAHRFADWFETDVLKREKPHTGRQA